MYVVRTEALDDLADGGCATCRAADRVERAWLLGLIDEIGDAKVRSALERGGGLCAAHVRLLVEVAVEFKKILGLGVVLECLLSQARAELVGGPRRWRSLAGPLRAAGPEPGCGACASVRLRELAYTELLLAPGDAVLQERAADPKSALCRPHLTALRAAQMAQSGSAPFEAAAGARVDELLTAVARSIDAHRVGSQSGPDAHGAVLKDAPEWLAGRAGTARAWTPDNVPRGRRARGSRS